MTDDAKTDEPIELDVTDLRGIYHQVMLLRNKANTLSNDIANLMGLLARGIARVEEAKKICPKA